MDISSRIKDKFHQNNLIEYVFLFLIIIIFCLQINNFFKISEPIGFDASGHIEYINYLKKFSKIPLPFEGWELWQPPLYYLIANFIPNVNLIKLIGLISYFSLIFTSYFFFKKIHKEKLSGFCGILVISMMPVIIYLTPSIGNEFFSGVLISLTLMTYLLSKNNKLSYIVCGILIGFSILAKATAFLALIAITVDIILQNKSKKQLIIDKIFYIYTTAFIISGWFYIRNIILFNNPLVTSFDFTTIHPLKQPVVLRNVYFFTTLKGFLTFDLFRAHHYSFLAGSYFSWFYDGHNILVPVQEFSKAGILIVILSIPIFILSIKGVYFSFKKIINQNRLFIIYTVLLMISYVIYNFKLPYYSTVKASFLISGIIPFTYFVIIGYKKSKLPYSSTLIFLVLYVIILIRNFWILPFWY